jgi:hypothetical protein
LFRTDTLKFVPARLTPARLTITPGELSFAVTCFRAGSQMRNTSSGSSNSATRPAVVPEGCARVVTTVAVDSSSFGSGVSACGVGATSAAATSRMP